MSWNIKVSGAYKNVPEPSVKVSGSWKDIAGGWEKVSGSWKQFFTSAVINITDQLVLDFQTDPDPAEAEYRIGADGVVYSRISVSGFSPLENWVEPTAQAPNYEVRVDILAGTLTGPEAVATWLATTVDRTWTVSQPFVGSGACDFTVSIRLAGGDGTVLDTATVSIGASVSS